MKTLKITTHWSPEEADCIYQLLDGFKEALWQCYGNDILQMHKTRHEEQQALNAETDFDDEQPF